MNFGAHANFIITSYAVTALIMGALIAWIVFDYAAQRHVLDEFEERGITRRSQRSKSERR
jgi:heme exporter protein D